MSKGRVLDPTTVLTYDITSPGPDAGPLAGRPEVCMRPDFIAGAISLNALAIRCCPQKDAT